MELVYDVGVQNGDDSAFYLHKGFRVVGVEASPVAIEKLQKRFARQIADGRYLLVAAGIAESAGSADFWVCDDFPQWSSFDPAIASRRGARHHAVQVETRRFRSILDQFGRGVFCKIDIEGNDNLCLLDLSEETRPAHLSVELIDGREQLELLRAKGYTGFKLISQRLLRQASRALLASDPRLPRLLRRAVAAAASRTLRYQPEPGWRFRGGSSGPFGEATPGRWQTFNEALQTVRVIEAAGDSIFDWYDIHARL